MTDSPQLSSLIVVNSRFARSVSITRDETRSDALEGYILTPNGRDILRRLATSLRGESSTRAWSLTGPYGSGKSSLALMAAQVLSGDDRIRLNARKKATQVLQRQEETAHAKNATSREQRNARDCFHSVWQRATA